MPGPEVMSPAVAEQAKGAATLGVVGTVNAMHGVTVSADLPGTVGKINVDPGKWVKEGEVLVQLRTRQ